MIPRSFGMYISPEYKYHNIKKKKKEKREKERGEASTHIKNKNVFPRSEWYEEPLTTGLRHNEMRNVKCEMKWSVGNTVTGISN